jgi:hypothetical protein
MDEQLTWGQVPFASNVAMTPRGFPVLVPYATISAVARVRVAD